ncbi:uncharacterized protein LOC113364119 [Ctenocephalides felis]|uniref:uncharacterized protein LOC113364119 n=1 Tax=Ctenocephalides felis TaxID=7515 RepID=UPI000E6E40B4|nr:uncharacterized protein LOC113364119 [Ctenocephalides felis]
MGKKKGKVSHKIQNPNLKKDTEIKTENNKSGDKNSTVSQEVTCNNTQNEDKKVVQESDQISNEPQENIEPVAESWDDITEVPPLRRHEVTPSSSGATQHENWRSSKDRPKFNDYDWDNKPKTEHTSNPNRSLDIDCENTALKFSEESKDLFTVSEDYSLCHCVAEDFTMGAGIAVLFRDKFGQVAELLQQRPKTGGFAYLKDKNRFIYYLVTKQRSTGKPRIEDLESSLTQMRDHMLENNVTKLAMPKIGCGLDRLQWHDVSRLIRKIFHNDSLDILVCSVDQTEPTEPNDITSPSKIRTVIKHRLFPLSQIETETLLVFTVSTQGEITPEMEELDKKYPFIMDFKRSKNRTLGDYYFIQVRNEWIVGLYVKQKPKDPFLYFHFYKALQKVVREKKNIRFIGMDYIEDENDVLLMDKYVRCLNFILKK